MEKLPLNTFQKDKNFGWSKDKIIVIALSALLLFGWFDGKVLNSSFENINVFLLIVLGIIMIYFKITSYFNRENLNGKLNGKLIFSTESISINDEEYFINQIEKIEIETGDFENRLTCIYGFDGNRSNGIENSIKITLNNSKKIFSQFQINYENQLWQTENILVHYCKLNKLNYYNLLNALNLEEYNQIQNFKKKHCL